MNGHIVDFHSHILPGVDDGAKTVDESLAMLDASPRAGVGCMIATPHFYADTNTPDHFLKKREAAWENLRAERQTRLPVVILGAEVHYFSGIGGADDIRRLTVDKTNILLLEMPFVTWTDRMLSDITELQESGMQVVLAHIERYLAFQKPETLKLLLKHRVLIQSNASFFINRRTRHKALKMLGSGEIHFLGSDAHNMTTRAPNLGEAISCIATHIGEDAVKDLQNRSMRILLGKS